VPLGGPARARHLPVCLFIFHAEGTGKSGAHHKSAGVGSAGDLELAEPLIEMKRRTSV
jgi:hypothetical protein